MPERHEHSYPDQKFGVHSFPDDLGAFYPRPDGLITSEWPPVQLTYLGEYLRKLHCKTILIEEHYVDRDFIGDVALFYARCLRNYRNYCRRLHFFSNHFDQAQWHTFASCGEARSRQEHAALLQKHYLGFTVVRPLPGCPVGRTILPTFPTRASDGSLRLFGGVRKYDVHIAGFELAVLGLAFQQQDQGVSACATTALWSALHQVAHREGLRIPTPGEITEAASRYALHEGRSFPSDGLTIDQLCEATRATGLSPLYVVAEAPAQDRGQILGYVASGFPPILAIQPLGSSDGHAVCGVGVRLGEVKASVDIDAAYRDSATAVRAVYVHDDRLGPYAAADIEPYTHEGRICTSINIRWPGTRVEFEKSILTALIVPLPVKIRLTIGRIRALASGIADVAGSLFPQFARQVTMHCQYEKGADYQRDATEFGLSPDGLYELLCETALSRYIGLIRLTVPTGNLFDAILDATETEPNPSMLCIVARGALPVGGSDELRKIARRLGVNVIS